MDKPKKITKKSVLKENDELRKNYMHAIYSIMEIRQAVGDTESTLSHRDLVDKIKALYESNNEKV
jgi:hypothetical protein|tara:strand:+ start:55 stop:249 length:195 start_codon:yes stop_codon:yes gene_type:complete